MELKSEEKKKKSISAFHRCTQSLMSRHFWSRRLPVFGFVRSYNITALLNDSIAALAVALTVIPQCVAIAVIANLPPQFGLYSAFVNGFVYAVLGSTREMSIGPTVVTAMFTQPYVQRFGPEAAVTICLASGCIVTLLGLFNMGFVVDLISAPVLAGFMSATGLNVMSGQIAPLLGIPGGGTNFMQCWEKIIQNIHSIRLWDTVLGVTCVIFLFALQYLGTFAESSKSQKLSEKLKIFLKYISLGRNAIIVLTSTAVIFVLSDRTSPVAIAGDIPEGLPQWKTPRLLLVRGNETLGVGETLRELVPALVMPLNIIVETMMSANAFAYGRTIDSSQEMLAVGACNIIGSFLQSFSVAGSITRTAINYNSGVKTTFGGILTGSLVLLSLVFLAPALKYLPTSTLAAVVFCAVTFLVRIHQHTCRLWKASKIDLIPLHATFLTCLVAGTDIGMIVGLLISALLLVYQAATPRVHYQHIEEYSMLVARPDRCLTYAGTERVRGHVTRHARTVRCLVLDGELVSIIDTTAAKVIKCLVEEESGRGKDVILWNWNTDTKKIFINYDKNMAKYFHNGYDMQELVKKRFSITPM